MDLCPSWTFSLHQKKMAALEHQCSGRRPTLIYTSNEDSHHTIPSKYSVAGTLFHRANTICSTPQLLQKEEEHLFRALTRCKYPNWAIKRAKMKSQNPNTRRTRTQTGQNTNHNNLYMVVPYHQGLSERYKKNMQQIWGASTFQRRTDHKKPPHGSKGQRSYHKQKWSHLQI